MLKLIRRLITNNDLIIDQEGMCYIEIYHPRIFNPKPVLTLDQGEDDITIDIDN